MKTEPAMPQVQLTISSRDSEKFALLSGDFNPLHLDPEKARRFPFGSTVVHGVHSCLLMLDAYLAHHHPAEKIRVEELKVSFNNPLSTGQPLTLCIPSFSYDKAIKLVGNSDGKKILSIKLKLSKDTKNNDISILDETAEGIELVEQEPPKDLEHQGSVQLKLHKTSYAALFPNLAEKIDHLWASQALASTAIVGMQCPGLHSIFSNLHLKYAENHEGTETISYNTSHYDERFRMINLSLSSHNLSGQITGFYRSQPAPQASIKELADWVPTDIYANQQALVVGGTRGIGETTSKILAAGGADVIITYATGKHDAERVMQEINAFGGKCQKLQLNVSNLNDLDSDTSKILSRTSHVYYFASPRIPTNKTGIWDSKAHSTLNDIYVTALNNLVKVIQNKQSKTQRLSLYYPSSVFITDNEKGFAEYIAAKAAGEALCNYLGAHEGITTFSPRLPRMYTDQTSELGKEASASTEEVMLNSLRNFAAMHTD